MMCIAVFEPDPTLRWLMSEILRDDGYAVETYRSSVWHEGIEVAIYGPNFAGPVLAPLQKVAALHFPHCGSIEMLSNQLAVLLPKQQKS